MDFFHFFKKKQTPRINLGLLVYFLCFNIIITNKILIMKTNTEKSVTPQCNEGSSKVTSGCSKMGKHDANLRKNSFLNFQIGLIIALVLVYVGLESSYAILDEPEVEITEIEESVIEYHPDVQNIKVEQPKKQKIAMTKPVTNPDVIKIIDDDVTDPKDFIDDTEVSPNEVVTVDDVVYSKVPIDVGPIPYSVVEDKPIFPGCEKLKKEKQDACFNKKMKKHIEKYFKYPELAQELRQEGRVSVIFKIGKDGSIKDIQMKGPAKILEEEAKRIISKLPKMTPGKQRGNAVVVPYSIPIHFKLQ